MKKWMLTIVAGVMVLVLAACNDTAEPTAEIAETEEEESELTARDVYSKALESSEEMESAEVTMNMKQQIESEADSTALDMESNFDMQMTMDPLAVYQKGSTKMMIDGEAGMPEMEIEMYMIDDGIYLYSDQLGNWVKMDNASMDAVNAMAGEQPDPSEQLKMLEEYMDDLSFEQSDNEFILKLNADGEKFNDLVQDMMEDSLPPEMMDAMGEEDQEIMENLTMNSVSYEIFIDKESFDMNAFNMDMDMTMEAEGEALHIVQNMESDYSNINNVDLIEVPEDVKDSAVEE
ncbi:hypothetical protein J2Z83_003582 [Virgibacillus natechei]|uniref:Lipoprotein n=1 Tax=Virgibacillus natechei TaxID=1216297 RepID=A0ABS4IKF3_9BACI|nr:DUF6612 family protein [Virgibacillus natechei]MBP1971443.1 hypothetical protein [Virgibacillus natechei]UZD13812.1 hypothetical protein OLD84_04470 [Virgibacillus natechei]